MRSYDHELFDAKHAATQAVLRLHRNDKQNLPVCDGQAAHEVTCALDNLNKAWGNLTDCLVRQREERDEQIRRLIDDLAESKKGR